MPAEPPIFRTYMPPPPPPRRRAAAPPRALRMQAREPEARALFEPEHQVHRLHAVAARPLHEVVDRRHHDDAIRRFVHFEPNVAEVRPCDDLRLRITIEPFLVLHEPHE